MVRNTQSIPLRDMRRMSCDVLVVGCGIAALYAALNVDPRLSVVMLNKDGLNRSSSFYAQGGIAAVTQDYDSHELHVRDTLTAGAGLCDREAVEVLVRRGSGEIDRLLALGVPFDRDGEGRLVLTREGAHSVNRILHCCGDATGKHMTSTLIRVAQMRKNITILNNHFLADLVKDGEGRVAGAIALDGEDSPVFFRTGEVILGTGGVGRLFRNSTNPRCITADGMAVALRAGARLRGMEFTQFHPTVLAHIGSGGRLFLISEALRGEGAILRNRRGEPFMQGQHPLADLAPRDVVARAIVFQMEKHDLPNVYLDITAKSRESLKARFPTIYAECMSRNIDIATNWIPVFPAQHYFMGGIVTDAAARTHVEGLYACGECASTGVHGANRLASNSLLECLVFGRLAAEAASDHCSTPAAPCYVPNPAQKTTAVDLELLSMRIREIMTKKCGIIRCETDMADALSEVEQICEALGEVRLEGRAMVELYNMALISVQMLSAAMARTANVGAHYRRDADNI